MVNVWLTDKVKSKLDDTAKRNNVTMEGLTNILLALSLSDDGQVAQALNLIKMWGLGGTTKLENINL